MTPAERLALADRIRARLDRREQDFAPTPKRADEEQTGYAMRLIREEVQHDTRRAEVAAARRLLDLALTGAARAEEGLADVEIARVREWSPSQYLWLTKAWSAALTDADEALALLDGQQP